mgnify:CR=1 FL=1
MNKQQKLNQHKEYEYRGVISYAGGTESVNCNLPWRMIYMEYEGDAIITPNTKDILLKFSKYGNKIYFKQLGFTNPKSHLFNYFGTLYIRVCKVYGFGGTKAHLSIKYPDFDKPQLMGTKPEDFTRLPENVKDGLTYHNKETLNIMSTLNSLKKPKKGIGRKGVEKSGQATSKSTSRGSSY